jgi:hypothetical protein
MPNESSVDVQDAATGSSQPVHHSVISAKAQGTGRSNIVRPGRLVAEEVAKLLGFKRHDIPILVRARLLKPLGNPSRNAVKYYATVEIEKLAADPVWLGRATRAVNKYWASQNQKRQGQKATP